MLKSAGGIQGIAESILPGLVFLVAFTITRDLTLSLVGAWLLPPSSRWCGWYKSGR